MRLHDPDLLQEIQRIERGGDCAQLCLGVFRELWL
jgi:hypothetical protein